MTAIEADLAAPPRKSRLDPTRRRALELLAIAFDDSSLRWLEIST